MSRFRWTPMLLACLLVVAPLTPLVGGGATAQAQEASTAGNNTTNTTEIQRGQLGRLDQLNGTTTPNGSNGSGDSSGRGGLYDRAAGGVESTWNDVTPDVPTTDDVANATANWTEEHLLNGTQRMLNASIGFVVGTTHPVNSGPNGVFGMPTNQPYQNLYQSVYGPYSFQYAVVVLLILLLGSVIVMPYAGLATGSSYRTVQTAARILAALVLIMFWWPLGTALTQFSDAIAVSIAPSAEELTTSMTGLFKLSLGPVVAAILVYLVGIGEVLALTFTYAFRQAALIVFQFAMPLMLIFAYAGPHRRVRSIASTLAWQYFALLVMTIPTAFLMRVGFEAEWGFGLGPLGNTIISMSMLGIALFTPFLLSIAAFRAPPAINSLASGAAGAAVATGSKAWDKGQGWTGPGEEDDVDEGREPIYVESYQPQERVAVADGGTPRGPGPQPVGALGSGGSSSTAEQIRDIEKRSSQPEGSAAAQKTSHYNQNDVIDVPSETVDSGGDGDSADGGDE